MDPMETEGSPPSDTDAKPQTESSTVETLTEAKPSLLDVVRDAIEPKAETSEGSSASSADDTGSAEGAEGDAASAEQPAENFDDLPFHQHPRFKKVLEERNSAANRIKELEPLQQEVERLTGPAKQYELIEGFMHENGVAPEEVVNLYRFGALSKSDPHGALELIQPILMDLWTRTGAILPDDLKTDVEKGDITEARARELAEQRTRADAATAREEKAAERSETVRTQTEQETATRAIQAKVVDWEATTKGKDPDYAAKEDLIADRLTAIMSQEGRPKTPEAMVAILDRAHTDVTAHLRKLLPPKPETRRTPTGGASATAQATPASFRQAIALAAAQGT